MPRQRFFITGATGATGGAAAALLLDKGRQVRALTVEAFVDKHRDAFA